jgi:mono/diheme cytochrome c family protein
MSSAGRRNLDADLASYDPATNSTVGDQMPNFSEFMTDEQVWDLVKFLKEEALDTDELYDFTTSGSYPTGTWTSMNLGKDGDAASGNTMYADANCAFCHGADGTEIIVDGSFSVGSFFRQKSNEAQHKVKFGQLGTQMLNLGITSVDDMKDLYKAMADETMYPDPGAEEPPPPGFEAADGIIGGRMFDRFWASETGWDFGANADHFSAFSNFYRCKQCHGWDLLANAYLAAQCLVRESQGARRRPHSAGVVRRHHAVRGSARPGRRPGLLRSGQQLGGRRPDAQLQRVHDR